jgi:hypothetical protein
MPYVIDLIEKTEFDTIYHQHLCYFSVTALDKLFRKRGLYLNDLRHLAIHGGSLRIYVEKNENVKASVTQYLQSEKEKGADLLDYYCDFANQVREIKAGLLNILTDLKSKDAHIAAYGAAAKACTLMNFCHIDNQFIDYIVDLNKYKQGRFFSGNHLSIRSPEALIEDFPEYTLLLVWNFSDEILKQQAEYREKGGKFILPIPEPKII